MKLLLDLEPLTRDNLFTSEICAALRSRYEVISRGEQPRDEFYAAHLADAAYVIGRPLLTRETLVSIDKLRAVFNFSTLLPKQTSALDCDRLGIRLLSPRPAVARPLGEHALALVLTLIRGIGARGSEHEDIGGIPLLTGRSLGIVGWGSSAHGVVDVFSHFCPVVRVSSVRASERELRVAGAQAATTDEVFSDSDIVIVMTPLMTHESPDKAPFIDASRLARLRSDAILVVMGRRELLDLDALVHVCNAGELRAAVEVEPGLELPDDHPARTTDGLLISNRPGSALLGNYRELGEAIAEDMERMDRGLLPVNCEPMDPSEFGENVFD